MGKQKVIIIGHGYTSRLGLIRSFGYAGFEVTVIVTMYGKVNAKKPLDCYSKFVGAIYYCGAKDETGLISILLNKCKDDQQKPVIIPDSDWSAAIVDSNKEVLKEFFVFPFTNNHNVEYWMDKGNQKMLASEIGLNTPKSVSIHIEEDKAIVPDMVEYPCFTKSLMTKSGGKQCFSRCDDKYQLESTLNSFEQKGYRDILIEDFVNIEKEYAIVGLSDGQDVLIPAVLEFIENCQCHNGIARLGKVQPVIGFEKQIALFQEYVRRTGFVGLFDIDFFYSQGKYIFGEMNFRFGGSGYSVTKMGVNLPALFVKRVAEDIMDPVLPITRSAIYVNERMCLDDCASRNISYCEYREAIKTADISFIYDAEDSLPQKYYGREVRKELFKSIVRRCLKK